jgi:TIGR03009 family protein
MRPFILAFAGVLGVALGATAQQPVQTQVPPALDPAHNKLDALLLHWENKMKSVDTLAGEITRMREDRVFRTRETFEGTAKYMKPNLALLDLHRTDKPAPAIFERYVCTGNFLYEYKQAEKELRFHPLPKPKAGQVADDNFLSFMFGMKAEDAKKRYDLKLVHEDKNYYYIEITPRSPADKQDFQKARLVLNRDSYLPRQLAFIDPTNNQTTWDIPRIESGVRLNRQDFMTPTLPTGWKLVRVPDANDVQPTGNKEPPPRVIRQQNKQ